MCTESYAEWLYHFLSSIEEFKIDTAIFLINFNPEKGYILKREFPKVRFFFEEREVELKSNGSKGQVYKVTYLKGEFMDMAYKMFNEPLLWIDCTALIRSNPQELLDKLRSQKALLMRRDTTRDYGKTVYAAEIFGMNDSETIEKYRADCEKRKKEWYSDQLALCEVKEKEEFKYGEWSNFKYKEDAKSWSDRGKTGIGIHTDEDYLYTKEKYIVDLYSRIPEYEDKFKKAILEIKKLDKLKILVHVDDAKWCYQTTAQEIAKRVDADFTVITNAGAQYEEVKNWHGDIVWARCSSKRHQKLLRIRPDLKKISFSSITTGGEIGEDRMQIQFEYCSGEAGVICQNEEIQTRARMYLKNAKIDMPVYILHNGVNLDKFKKTDHKGLTVGFVGRAKLKQEDDLKGYSNLIVPACKEVGLDLKIASTKIKALDHEEMPEFYKSIDLLVLMSTAEGHSNTLNEAMACGLPIISTPVGWHYENAKDQGITWCQRNIKELIEKLQEFKENPEKYQKLGAINRKFAEENLSWDKVAKHYQKVFEDMRGREGKNHKIPVKHDRIVKYIGKDSMMNSYGTFVPGRTQNVGSAGYRYLKENFPNKFEFLSDGTK